MQLLPENETPQQEPWAWPQVPHRATGASKQEASATQLTANSDDSPVCTWACITMLCACAVLVLCVLWAIAASLVHRRRRRKAMHCERLKGFGQTCQNASCFVDHRNPRQGISENNAQNAGKWMENGAVGSCQNQMYTFQLNPGLGLGCERDESATATFHHITDVPVSTKVLENQQVRLFRDRYHTHSAER